MQWKELPTWLKGGIIGSIVYPIIYILLGGFTLVCANSISLRESAAICYPLAILPIIPVIFAGLIIYWGFGIQEFGTNLGAFNIPTILVIWGFVGSIFIGFILGSIIGPILDMMRTTKQQVKKEKVRAKIKWRIIFPILYLIYNSVSIMITGYDVNIIGIILFLIFAFVIGWFMDMNISLKKKEPHAASMLEAFTDSRYWIIVIAGVVLYSILMFILYQIDKLNILTFLITFIILAIIMRLSYKAIKSKKQKAV